VYNWLIVASNEGGSRESPVWSFETIERVDAPFARGDANADAALDVSDAVTILGYLFLGTAMNDCEDAADVNDDGGLDISDAVRLLGYLFLGLPRPPDPFGACGSDPTEDDLGCQLYDRCP
ncbi:MAG: dockerin type I repeat-containing protein, partial [Planctomycetes bacterium]|nr:dockerin type I repeat-containing protein [Planctomycetota bacterium]